jgi:hypothetical protein
MTIQRLALIGSFAAATLALAACATLRVGSYVDRRANFASYRTYAWDQPDALPTGDPRLDRNPFFRDYVEGAIDKGFAERGLAAASPAQSDLLVHYHISVTEHLDVTRFEQAFGYCRYEECEPFVQAVEAGTLVIDVHDARTRALVWRGWARDFVEAALLDQDVMKRQFTNQVKKTMADFPVRVAR